MLRNLLLSAITLSALSISTSASAKTWFEVEVFIFERQTNVTEQWPNTPAPQINERAIDLITPVISTDISGVASGLNSCIGSDWSTDNPSDCNDPLSSNTVRTHPSNVPFSIAADKPQQAYLNDKVVLLSESQSKFAEIIKAVSRERNVKPMLHLTWQQDMQSKRRTKPIRIFAGKDFSDQFEYHGQQIVEKNDSLPDVQFSMNDFSNFGQFIEPQHVKPVWEIDGTINIYLSHYLYIENDLALRKPIQKLVENHYSEFNEFDAVNTQVEKTMQPFLQSIPLKQNRRVRSGEIHYFDHPQMGIVMQIRKMAQPTMSRPIDLGEASAETSTNLPENNFNY
ncbi:peptidoglycan binding protein CsiV [Shewanella gaetbuli]|uniref:Peptidoglycan binding protein CsiV n=1 Tax=Shewanella gaetbuli TaxID=220752 RepID=A0A9X1ZIU8_9GAMM|nr:peptidoglycan binding protein CsiV [Shewanella gaetbuli]